MLLFSFLSSQHSFSTFVPLPPADNLIISNSSFIFLKLVMINNGSNSFYFLFLHLSSYVLYQLLFILFVSFLSLSKYYSITSKLIYELCNKYDLIINSFCYIIPLVSILVNEVNIISLGLSRSDK